MIAEIISIGDELTSGVRLDTNTQAISLRLGDIGIKVHFHTTVGDTLADNIAAFRIAAARADIVIASGGLGPTADDLTREAMAEAFHCPLEFREEAMQHIESLFAQRKRPMPERNRVQAMFPRGSKIIDNPHGTAPGIDLAVTTSIPEGSTKQCRIFALPGVPAEMLEMLEHTVEKRLCEEMGAGQDRLRFHSLKLFGIGESDVEQLLPNLIARDRDPRVGITVSKATITLRIAAQTATESEFQRLIQPTIDEVRGTLGQLIFGEGNVELHQAVHRLLSDRKLRLGLLEVGAGCWIAPMMSQEQDGGPFGLRAADWCASERELHSRLSISATLPNTHSQLTDLLKRAAESMLNERNIDVVLAVGTYPTLEEVTRGAGLPHTDFTMCLAVAGKPPASTTISIGGHPEVLYHRLAKSALNFLRLELSRA
jgi:nicotinamide-nucleotide amidase